MTSYIVERRDAKRNTWMSAGTTQPTDLEFVVTKLIEGNEYLIRVFAENSVGVSEPAQTEPVTAKNPFGMHVMYLSYHELPAHLSHFVDIILNT